MHAYIYKHRNRASIPSILRDRIQLRTHARTHTLNIHGMRRNMCPSMHVRASTCSHARTHARMHAHRPNARLLACLRLVGQSIAIHNTRVARDSDGHITLARILKKSAPQCIYYVKSVYGVLFRSCAFFSAAASGLLLRSPLNSACIGTASTGAKREC
jgi:hypothetical protein